MRKKLQDYLPPVLLKTYEFPLLCDTEQPEIDRLNAAADAVLDAQFVTTAGDQALVRYEKIFGIVPQDTDTLEERRFRVQATMNAALPYTVRRLKMQLEAVCGAENVTLTINYAKYTVTVRVALTAKRNFDAVTALLASVVPANMKLDCDLMYNQYLRYNGLYTHAQLAAFTHQQLREDVTLSD